MRQVLLLGLVLLLGSAMRGVAQTDGLIVRDAGIIAQLDALGEERPVLVGTLWNEGDTAVSNVVLYADILDAAGAVIGEGFGYIVNSCGEAWLDRVLFPKAHARIALKVELFEAGAQPSAFEFYPEATPSETTREVRALHPAITPISDEEVVAVEWLNDVFLRYGAGCDEQLFTRHQWHLYDTATGADERLDGHPNAQYITPRMISNSAINRVSQTLQDDPTHIERSFLTFSPNGARMVWQTEIHTLYTGERDGTFRREVHRFLHQYSLKGFVWSPANNFTAYYFGGYGDDVRYLTATLDGNLISNVITANPLSRTIPGMMYDGQRVIIGTTFEDVSGFYLQNTKTPERELLFEFDTLNNNYPAPAYFRKDGSTRYIYFVLPDSEAGAVLTCYHYEEKTNHILAELPLRLQNDERAWTWLAPDGDKLALGAKGREGGLWLIDLRAFDVCG